MSFLLNIWVHLWLVYGKIKTSHFAPSKKKNSHFAPLAESIVSFLNAWSTHTLSYASRLELLKAIIQGVEAFWIQNFPIPSSIIDKICRICRNFLWAGSRLKVAWIDICTPKNEGSLGLRDCNTWNKAMLFRILWDIHSSKCTLWIQWIHAFYLRRKDVSTCSHGRDDHPLFKNIQKLRDSLITHVGSIHNSMQLLGSWLKNGKFYTSLAYDWLRHKRDKKPWMSLIWRTYIPPKHSFIMWLAMRGRLNTKDHWMS